MIRTQYSLAMIAAAIGVPYTATETEFGRNLIQTVSSQSAAVTSAVGASTESVHSHRDVERIWEESVDRFRYASTPVAVQSRANGAAATSPVAIPTSPVQPELQGAGGMGPGGVGAAAYGNPAALVGGPIFDLREVLRFDISPEWVMSRFSRVTTVLADTELEGLRVPLVTGIGPADLAGSITYYFDASGKLQRVMLHAFTGDASRVVATMTQFYGLQAEPSLDAGVYTRRWNAMPVHFLRLTRAPVVYSDALHHKLTVYLELNQPDLRYGISTEAQRIIDADRRTGRW
ncbi:MAG TPA: hypothetical protein DDZ51_29040 [Planctomycetaceae bacterium]|nr:hypothetical protein [Planctomycetaceae bacterium]